MRETENPRHKQQSLYNQISEVIRHHFCHMLLVTQTNSVTMWEGTVPKWESQEAGSLRAILKAAYHKTQESRDLREKCISLSDK